MSERRAASATAGKAPASQQVIMIIDSDHERRLALSRLVETFGYQVLSFPDTTQLDHVRRGVAAVMVVNIGGANFQAASRVASIAEYHKTPVLAIGHGPKGSDRRTSLFSSYMGEPFSRREMAKELGRLAMRKNAGKDQTNPGKPIVLVIENNLDMMGAIRRYLESVGLMVLPAMDAAGAWRYASRLRPDAVLTEIELPDGRGTDVIRQFRERFPGIMLVAIGSDAAASREARDSGAEHYFAKPVRLGELAAVLLKSLGEAVAIS